MKIAVVGLGIAGLSIAARLGLSGHDVVGFERFAPLHANGSSHGDSRIIRLSPGEGEAYVSLARRAARLWRLWEGFAGAPLINWTGGYMAGPQGSPFVASCQRLSERPAALMRGDAVHALTRGRVAMPYAWDVFRQDDVGVIAADATRAMLLRQVPRWGAKLVHGVRIDAIEGRTVRIGGERVNFDAVIVAAGAWAGALLPEFAPRLSVRRRVLAWFRPETPGPMPVLCVDNEEGVYGMPASRGLYKLGLHSVGGVTDPDGVAAPGAEDEAMLARFAAMLLPEHDPLPVKMERCLYTVTPDEHFLIRPSMNNERVLLFSACSGHGFKYAPAFGQLAEAWLKDANAPVLAPFNGVHGSARGGGARLGGAKS